MLDCQPAISLSLSRLLLGCPNKYQTELVIIQLQHGRCGYSDGCRHPLSLSVSHLFSCHFLYTEKRKKREYLKKKSRSLLLCAVVCSLSFARNRFSSDSLSSSLNILEIRKRTRTDKNDNILHQSASSLVSFREFLRFATFLFPVCWSQQEKQKIISEIKLFSFFLFFHCVIAEHCGARSQIGDLKGKEKKPYNI